VSTLRDRLEHEASGFVARRDAFDRVTKRVAHHRLVRRVGAGSVAVVVSLVAVAVLLRVAQLAPAPPVSTPTPVPTPTETPSALPYEGLRIGARVRTDGWNLVADGFGVHVAGAGSLQNVDPRTGQAAQPARIGTWDYDFTVLGRYGDGSVWVASGQELWFVGGSPEYAVGRHYDLSGLGYLHAIYQASPSAGGGTWLAISANSQHRALIAEFDPDSGRIIRRFDAGSGAYMITDSDGFIVTSVASGRAAILRINPRTGQVATKHLSRTPQGLAATEGRVWWTSGGGAVNCVEVETLTDCGSVYIPRAAALAGDGSRLWVLSVTGSKKAGTYVPDPSEPATVTLMNGLTGDVLAGPLPLPEFTPASFSSYDGHAWVGFHDTGTVVRIDRDRAG
jgi:hypothetical protein